MTEVLCFGAASLRRQIQNHLAVPAALLSAGDGAGEFLQGHDLIHGDGEFAVLHHLGERMEDIVKLGAAGLLDPLGDPEAAELELFEDEKGVFMAVVRGIRRCCRMC